MSVVLDRLDRSDVMVLWSILEPYFAAACAAVNTSMTAEDVRQAALADKRSIWTIIDKDRDPPALLAVCSAGMRDTPNGKTAFIEVAAGWDREAWVDDCLAEFERLAKAAGAVRVEIEGRMGWQRVLPGYRPVRVVLEKCLHL